MNTYLISYDLRGAPNIEVYNRLHAAIDTLVNKYWAKPLKSVYIVKSSLSAVQITQELLPYIRNTDQLIVTQLTGNWAGFNLSENVEQWLRNNL